MNQVATNPPFAQETPVTQLLLVALEHSPEGLALVTGDGNLLYSNPTFRRLLPGHSLGALSESARAQIRTLSAEGHLTLQADLSAAPESNTTVEIIVRSFSWEGRSMRLIQLRDISAHRDASIDARRAQQHELLGRVSSGIVHDANNIFTAIMGSASLLQMGDTERATVHLDNILKSSQRGAALLRRISAFSRSADGAVEQLNLAEQLAESTAIARDTLGGDGPIAFAADDELPLILGDQAQLHQIIMALCANAREAQAPGAPIMILVRRQCLDERQARDLGQGARAGDFVVLSVQDRGRGIAPEDRPRLFEPFFTTKPKGQGVGLGLATAIRHVRRHGGFMTVDTEVGRGSRFACYFPVARS